jgi:hypothetical protein
MPAASRLFGMGGTAVAGHEPMRASRAGAWRKANVIDRRGGRRRFSSAQPSRGPRSPELSQCHPQGIFGTQRALANASVGATIRPERKAQESTGFTEKPPN